MTHGDPDAGPQAVVAPTARIWDGSPPKVRRCSGTLSEIGRSTRPLIASPPRPEILAGVPAPPTPLVVRRYISSCPGEDRPTDPLDSWGEADSGPRHDRSHRAGSRRPSVQSAPPAGGGAGAGAWAGGDPRAGGGGRPVPHRHPCRP